MGRGNQRGQMVNTLFTMLLFLVFVLCALFAVLIGGKVYENINIRTESTYRADVALSYIANKVRQQDTGGMVELTDENGTAMLRLKQIINDRVYHTDIYYRDGKLYELFTAADSGLGVNDGIEIMECDEVVMAMEDGLIHVKTEGGSVWLALRSGGPADE